MPKRKRPYHHGDLAEALQTEALQIVQTDGLGGVSLRELGRRLGVSRSAPYRHFVDKEALLVALARRGFAALTRAMLEEVERRAAFDAKQRLDALAFGYLKFALNEPGYFRLVFGRRDFEREHSDLRSEGEASFRVLVEAVADCQRAGLIAGTSPDAAALLCWTTVHGFAALLLDGHLDVAVSESVLDGLLVGLYDGLRARASQR
jgi:AcrR family transcriptional regulator